MADSERAVLMVLESVFPAIRGGGAETQVRTLGVHLQQRGWKVRVVVPMVAYGQQIAREKVDGLSVVRIVYPRIRFIGGVIMLAKLFAMLLWRRREYAVIHAHIANHMASVCCVAGWLLKKPVIVKLTGMMEMNSGVLGKPGFVARLMRLALRRATYYHATSEQIREMLIECGYASTKIRLVPNAVDTDRFACTDRDLRLRKKLCGDALIVGVFVGRLAPEKGLLPFLRCWSRVFKTPGHAALILVGEGPLMASLRAEVLTLGLEYQVILIGHSDRPEQYLALADYGVLPSLREGLSNSLLEYMAAGLPVLGSRISGTEDLVVPAETGWLFAAGDEAQLESCLVDLGATPLATIKDMGRQAHRRIMEYASTVVVGQQVLQLYDSTSTE